MSSDEGLMVDIGTRVRHARQAVGWSQTDLAERAGVSRPSVARVEAGDDVSTATLTKIAGALGFVLTFEAGAAS